MTRHLRLVKPGEGPQHGIPHDERPDQPPGPLLQAVRELKGSPSPPLPFDAELARLEATGRRLFAIVRRLRDAP